MYTFDRGIMYSTLGLPGEAAGLRLGPRRTRSPRQAEPVLEPVRGAVDGDDLRMMEQAVEDGGGQDFIAQHLRPLRERLVTGEDEAPPLVTAADELKKVVGLRPIEPEIPDFIHHQHGWFEIGLQLLLELAPVLSGLKLSHEIIQSGEGDGEPPLAGRDGQGHGEMRLPRPGRPQEDDIGLLLHEPEGGQLP